MPISIYLATLVYTHLPFCFDRVAVERVIELFKQSETDQSWNILVIWIEKQEERERERERERMMN